MDSIFPPKTLAQHLSPAKPQENSGYHVARSCTKQECSRPEGPEGVKWELGLAYFSPGKMGFRSLGLGFGYWEWEESVKNGNGINIL